MARGDQIVAIPTLVRNLPAPMRKIIGDLSNTERVLVGLDLRPAPAQKGESMHPRKLKRKEYVLRLYVAGTTSRSIRAVANIKEICESSLKNRYDLEVIDIYQQPVLLKGEQIIAGPTLSETTPFQLRKFIGDMSDTERILVGLD